MSYEFYKTLHLAGIFLILLALGGIGFHMINGGNRNFTTRRGFAILHGIGLVLSLVAGFGLLARGGHMASATSEHAIPLWAVAKLLIWLWMGAVPALFYRRSNLAKTLWVMVFILASTSAWLAIFKPF